MSVGGPVKHPPVTTNRDERNIYNLVKNMVSFSFNIIPGAF